MAIEALGYSQLPADPKAGTALLSQALTCYTGLGATWDARRVRSRLRDLGIHRRLVLREPATNGWSAMTAPEASVAELVAEGLTNREVAERLFLSPHTVNSHLRHVFTKLGIKSRVELARFHQQEADAASAGRQSAWVTDRSV
jgi:DNA-binding CsgD family transcriptional regulator